MKKHSAISCCDLRKVGVSVAMTEQRGRGWRCQFRQTAHLLKFYTCHGLRRFSNLLKSAAERGENERVECSLTVKAKLVSLELGLRTLAGNGENLLHYTSLGMGPVP